MSRVALAPGRAREYETIYVLRPNIEKDVASGVATRVADAIKSEKGLLTQAELWGSRRLAYPISRHYRGTYVYIKYLARGNAVAELERQLRLADSVIRYQTIQLRSDVPFEDAPVEDTALDFDMPFEPDEPERTYERELGLDTMPSERRRRDERRYDDDSGDDGDTSNDDGAADKASDDNSAEDE